MSQKVIIVTAPSGAGKTTIVKALLDRFKALEFSVSATTRVARDWEVNGKDYYFLSKEEFLKHIADDNFLEWEEVYSGSYYGTLKSEVDRLWNSDKVIVFDVDVKGADNLKRYFGKKSLSIFIKPPSLEILKKRLVARKSENEDSLRRRLERAEIEMLSEKHFDIVVVNDSLNTAISEVQEHVKNFIT